jgi:hypothetical protein
MSSPTLLHLLARRAKRKCGAAGSEPVNTSGSEAAAGRPTSRLSLPVATVLSPDIADSLEIIAEAERGS